MRYNEIVILGSVSDECLLFKLCSGYQLLSRRNLLTSYIFQLGLRHI